MVTLKWQDNSNNETGFSLLRQRQVNGAWSEPATFSLPANTTSYVDNPTVAGTYQYQVRAFNATGFSDPSNWAMVIVQVIPVAPSNFRAASSAANSVRLTWKDNSNNEASFIIHREVKVAGFYGSIAKINVPTNTISYIDHPARGQYRYRVAAANSAGTSAFTGWASINV